MATLENRYDSDTAAINFSIERTFIDPSRVFFGSYIHGRIRTMLRCQLGGASNRLRVFPIESNAPIFPPRSSLRPRSTRDAYVKGLDNSTPESYSKLHRFLLRGQAAPRCSSFFHSRHSTIPRHPTPPFAPSSRPHFSPSVLRTRPRTSKRQFDKMQISFVSLTTIGSSASSFFSIFLSSLFSLFPPRPSSSSAPSRHQQPAAPFSSFLLALPSFPFSLFPGYFVFSYLLLFNRRSLVCPCQILRAISAEVYH